MKRNTLERREKIKDLILEKSLWSLNKKKLARDFKVSYPTIYNDIKVILREIPDDKMEEIAYELRYLFKEAIMTAKQLMKKGDDTVKLRAIEILMKATKRYKELYYGINKIESSHELDLKLKDIGLL